MEGNKVRLVVKISPDQKATLEKMRAKSGVTVSEIVRRLITAGLKRPQRAHRSHNEPSSNWGGIAHNGATDRDRRRRFKQWQQGKRKQKS